MTGIKTLEVIFDEPIVLVDITIDQERMNNSPNAVKFREDGLKCRARLLLADSSKRLLVPTPGEWIGLNLQDRDN